MPKIKISDDRKKYLRKKRIKKASVIFTQISILVIIILAWEMAANKGLIDSFIMSQPSKILKTFINLSSNDLFTHIWVTCKETLVGFLLGTGIGILIAIIFWWSNFLSKVSEPYLVILNSLPKVALRASNNNLGRSRNLSNYNYGNSNITYCNHIRYFKWIFRNRQGKNKNGKNV